MITRLEVNETNNMIEHENLDVRTITLGISLLDCCDSDLGKLNERSTTRSRLSQRILFRQENRLSVISNSDRQ